MFHDVLRYNFEFPTMPFEVKMSDYTTVDSFTYTSAAMQFTALSTLLLGTIVDYTILPTEDVNDPVTPNSIKTLVTSDVSHGYKRFKNATTRRGVDLPYYATTNRMTTAKRTPNRMRQSSTKKTKKSNSVRIFSTSASSTSDLNIVKRAKVPFPPFYIRMNYFPPISTVTVPQAYIYVQVPLSSNRYFDTIEEKLYSSHVTVLSNKESSFLGTDFSNPATSVPVFFNDTTPSYDSSYVAIILISCLTVVLLGKWNYFSNYFILTFNCSAFIAYLLYKKIRDTPPLNDIELVRYE